MQDIDVVVVPSIWWENSPVVIQEARLAGRPILCSDIGGMAEKAAEIAGSQTFRTGSAQHLAARIEALLRERESAQPEVEAKAIIERRDAALGAHRAAAEQLLRLLEGERLPAKPQRAPAPA
jgi:glycosyltransferase involved in cell wall biosynthesis